MYIGHEQVMERMNYATARYPMMQGVLSRCGRSHDVDTER